MLDLGSLTTDLLHLRVVSPYAAVSLMVATPPLFESEDEAGATVVRTTTSPVQHNGHASITYHRRVHHFGVLVRVDKILHKRNQC